jgi:hypothetical protein
MEDSKCMVYAYPLSILWYSNSIYLIKRNQVLFKTGGKSSSSQTLTLFLAHHSGWCWAADEELGSSFYALWGEGDRNPGMCTTLVCNMAVYKHSLYSTQSHVLNAYLLKHC